MIRRLLRTFSFCSVALLVAAAAGNLLAAAPGGAPVPGAAPTAAPPAPPAAPSEVPILAGRPADPALDDPTLLLGGTYENKAAGIAFRTPTNSRRLAEQGDEIARFVNEQRKWELVATRTTSATPMRLSSAQKPGAAAGGPPAAAAPKADGPAAGPDSVINPVAPQAATPQVKMGLLEVTAGRLKTTNPGVEIIRQEVVNVGEFEAGVLGARFNVGDERKLYQQAIVQANDQLYYVLTMTSPAPKDAKGADSTDPGEIAAAEAFRQVIDSVKLLDRGEVRVDQTERLVRTRALFVNLTPRRVRSALVPEQWMRLIRNGKDIGYTYIVEEADETAGKDGIKIGIRSRTYPEADLQVDGETWYFVSGDRAHENWSNLLWVQNRKNKTSEQVTEFGASDRSVKKVMAGKGPFPKGENPPVREVEIYTLNVQTLGNAPLKQELSPWYLPQALSHLLPRLLPLGERKSFMFAVYVGDQGKVMHRYVEVGAEQMVDLNGQQVRAVPITDRVKLEGSVTTHYVSPEGKYLGSVNKDSGIMILPTDAQTLLKTWQNADLSRPKEVKPPPAAGPAAAAPGAP